MDARPVIYVNRITHLSDARYCAGMGADLLGFVVTPGHPDYVSPVQFREIMGWVSGPRSVLEIIPGEAVNLEEVIAQYAPDLLHLHGVSKHIPELTHVPLIVELPYGDLNPELEEVIRHSKSKIAYLIISGTDQKTIASLSSRMNTSILMPMTPGDKSIAELQPLLAAGLVLQGSPELKPGLKDYDHLSGILEALDA